MRVVIADDSVLIRANFPAPYPAIPTVPVVSARKILAALEQVSGR